MGNKYLAEGIYCNPTTFETSKKRQQEEDIYFASLLEMKMYRFLRSKLPHDCIVCQFPMILKESTVLYPEITWKVDFLVIHPNPNKRILVETKGKALDEFKRNLALLERQSRYYWERLHVVGARMNDIDENLMQVSMMQFKRYFENKFLSDDWHPLDNPCLTKRAHNIVDFE